MRGLTCLLALTAVSVAPAPASANKASNPAFLGVGMGDLGGAAGAGPCVIHTIEPGSGAAAALLQPGDAFERLDGLAIPSCDALIAAITARAPGAFVTLDMRRDGQAVRVRAELLARDEILRRRLVGHALPPSELVRVEDRARVDLAAVKRTTIVGWYPQSCGACPALIDEVGQWSRARAARRAPIDVLAATSDFALRQSRAMLLDSLALAQRSLAVPLLAADPDIYLRFAMRDIDRVHFAVIDARGTVEYIAPIAPGTEDSAAMLDELYAAAEQIARRPPR